MACAGRLLASAVTLGLMLAVNMKAAGAGSQASSPWSEDTLKRADFFFKGRVVGLATSNVSQWASGPNFAVVLIEQVFVDPGLSSAPLSRQVGQQITVRVADPSSLLLGGEYVFATTIVLDEEHLAVVEVQHETAPKVPLVLDGQIERVSSGRGTLGQRSWAATVDVDKAYRSNEVATDISQGALTVRIQSPGVKPSPSQHVTLVVQKLAPTATLAAVSTPQQADPLHAQMQGALRYQWRQRIQTMCGLSADVVRARVITLGTEQPFAVTNPTSGGIPLLKSANILVEDVLKGHDLAKDTTAQVWFVDKADLNWRGAPRLSIGERAILFLHHASEFEIPLQKTHDLGIYESGDVLSPDASVACQKGGS